jgi:hypothetical protein
MSRLRRNLQLLYSEDWKTKQEDTANDSKYPKDARSDTAVLRNLKLTELRIINFIYLLFMPERHFQGSFDVTV